ncbi:hypothetical protein [Bradyrhizobium lupini]|uniref:hypothetical protein n=1 Tax=Rhizobium lupini TaxID=136996 RepID=UPI0034C5B9A6
MNEHTPSSLFTREQLRLRLNERGFPLTRSYWSKLNLPSVNAGPPVAKWFGRRPLYKLEDALAWAESRCGSTRGKLATQLPKVGRPEIGRAAEAAA